MRSWAKFLPNIGRGGGPRGTLWNSKVKISNSTKKKFHKFHKIPHRLFKPNFSLYIVGFSCFFTDFSRL